MTYYFLSICRECDQPMPQELDKIYFGKCQDILKTFSSESIDLIVTSPPYALNRKSTYGGVKIEEYVDWFLPISEQLKRVLNSKGSFIFNIKERAVDGQRQTYVYKLILEMIDQGWIWVEDYMWHKKNTTPGKWPNRFRDCWEHCYHFTKEKKFNMYQDAVMVPVKSWAKKRLANLSDVDKQRDNSKTKSGFGKKISNWVDRDLVYPDNVLHLATECSNRNHSAVFPETLPKWFIKLFSKKNDVVLDPFLGSGTTAVVALKLGRHYIGIEKKKEYYESSIKRIDKIKRKMDKQMHLFENQDSKCSE